jgi:hypothetical protein
MFGDQSCDTAKSFPLGENATGHQMLQSLLGIVAGSAYLVPNPLLRG